MKQIPGIFANKRELLLSTFWVLVISCMLGSFVYVFLNAFGG